MLTLREARGSLMQLPWLCTSSPPFNSCTGLAGLLGKAGLPPHAPLTAAGMQLLYSIRVQSLTLLILHGKGCRCATKWTQSLSFPLPG